MEKLELERARLEDAKRRIVKNLKVSEDATKAPERKNQDLIIQQADALDEQKGDLSFSVSCPDTSAVPSCPGSSTTKSGPKRGQLPGIPSRACTGAASPKGEQHVKQRSSCSKIRQKKYPDAISASVAEVAETEHGICDQFACVGPACTDVEIATCKGCNDEHLLHSSNLDCAGESVRIRQETEGRICKDTSNEACDETCVLAKSRKSTSRLSSARARPLPTDVSCDSTVVYCGSDSTGALSGRRSSARFVSPQRWQRHQGKSQANRVFGSKRTSSRSPSPRRRASAVADDAARQVMWTERASHQPASRMYQADGSMLPEGGDSGRHTCHHGEDNHTCKQRTCQPARSLQKGRQVSSLVSMPTSGIPGVTSAGSSRASSCQPGPPNSRKSSPTAKTAHRTVSCRPLSRSRRASPQKAGSSTARPATLDTPSLPLAQSISSPASCHAFLRVDCMQRNFDQAVVEQWQTLHARWPAVQLEGNQCLLDDAESVDDSSAPSTPMSATLLSVDHGCCWRAESECRMTEDVDEAGVRCEIVLSGDRLDEAPTSVGDDSSSDGTSTIQPEGEVRGVSTEVVAEFGKSVSVTASPSKTPPHAPPCIWCPSTGARHTHPTSGLAISQASVSARLEAKRDTPSVITLSPFTGVQRILQSAPQTENPNYQAECRLSPGEFAELVAVIRGQEASAVPSLKLPRAEQPTMAAAECSESMHQPCATPQGSVHKVVLGPGSPATTFRRPEKPTAAGVKRDTSRVEMDILAEPRSRAQVRSPCTRTRVVPSPSPTPVILRVASAEQRALTATPQVLHTSQVPKIQCSSEPTCPIARRTTDSVATCSSLGNSAWSRVWPWVHPPKSETLVMRHVQSQPQSQTHPPTRVVVTSSSGMGSLDPPCSPPPGCIADWNHKIVSGTACGR